MKWPVETGEVEMKKLNVFAAALLISASGAIAQEAAPEDVTTETNIEAEAKAEIAVEDEEASKEICRSFREIGSRLAKRKVCKTQAEWDKDREANADALRKNRGSGGPQLGNEG